ncbi:hypothetical protein PENANT_c022G11005 [Penicillium antarcticum]|uniref:Uncharacterized protein n=1 Tax=Penicillium antarcticum TaxID=416450 RepID=A0A1V6PZ74_9EURO|nr:uncharacterized protein N7508_002759 [Penicillium antarcticum]KAJ5311929.1 hypothetical protein N7508_002759 [Penicillium antarcticum]OQD82328.1 hypothetical protein PENANT_c022G11005 [Penicillium antarcticum]
MGNSPSYLSPTSPSLANPSPVKRWSPMADPSVARWHARDGRREKRSNQRDGNLNTRTLLNQLILSWSCIDKLAGANNLPSIQKLRSLGVDGDQFSDHMRLQGQGIDNHHQDRFATRVYLH